MGGACMLANAGTPLMWAGMCHLLVGNALIGLLEASVISRVFRAADRGRLRRSMVFANYFSMFVGYVGLSAASVWFNSPAGPNWTIKHVIAIQAAALFASFVLTVLIEYPFVWRGLGSEYTARQALRANLAAQAASYLVLVVLYRLLSNGLIWPLGPVSVAEPRDFAASDCVWIYYIAAEDGDLWRIRANGEKREHMLDVSESGDATRLFARERREDGRWDLCLETDYHNEIAKPLISSFAALVAHKPGRRATLDDPATTMPASHPATAPAWPHWEVPSGSPYARAAHVDESATREWSVSTGSWPGFGVTVSNSKTGRSLWVSLESPLFSAMSRYPVILPQGQVVYQLGRQIVLLDPTSKKLGLLALGTGLVVVPD